LSPPEIFIPRWFAGMYFVNRDAYGAVGEESTGRLSIVSAIGSLDDANITALGASGNAAELVAAELDTPTVGSARPSPPAIVAKAEGDSATANIEFSCAGATARLCAEADNATPIAAIANAAVCKLVRKAARKTFCCFVITSSWMVIVPLVFGGKSFIR
jgi:hypothetical protein